MIERMDTIKSEVDDATSEGASTLIGDGASEATLHSFMLESEASNQFTATDYEAPFVVNYDDSVLGLLRDPSSKSGSFHSESSEEESEVAPNYLTLEFDDEPQQTSVNNTNTNPIIPIIIDDTSMDEGFVDSDSNKEDCDLMASSLYLGIEDTQQVVGVDNEATVSLDCEREETKSTLYSEKTACHPLNERDIVETAESCTELENSQQCLETKNRLSLAIRCPEKDAGSSEDSKREELELTTHTSVHYDMLDERFHMMFNEEDSEILTQPSLDEHSISSIVIDRDRKEAEASLGLSSPIQDVRDFRFKTSQALLYQPRELPKSFGLVYGHGSPAYLHGVSLGVNNSEHSRDLPQSHLENNSNHKSIAIPDLIPSNGSLSTDLNNGSSNANLNHSRVSNSTRHRPMMSLDLIYGNGASSAYLSGNPLGSDLEQPENSRSTRRDTSNSSRSRRRDTSSKMKRKPIELKALRIEAFCYNHGMEIAMGVLYLALNYVIAAHGAYQFTEAGGFTTDNDLLRITLPIARAGGRLVTFNCAVLLLTSCKCLWTMIRTHVAPVIPIGFPIDDVMPKYHRYVALIAIVSGCTLHTLPQIVNYATKSTIIDKNGTTFWTFGNGTATKQLLVTGTLLTIIFSTFFLTTLKAFRKTAAGFRWFWFFHVGGIATAYPLLLMHGTCKGHPVFLYFAMVPLVLYLFDISMRRTKISTTEILRWKTHEDQGQQITELVVRRPLAFTYTPGQYVELRFHPISEREWHPFTIASAPNERSHGNQEMTFYIKNLGRWTGALFDCASAFDLTKTKKPLEIDIRGPHGAPAMNYFEYKHILVIGSGVGVAPLLSIWKYLVARGQAITDVKRRKFRNPFLQQSNQAGPRDSIRSEDTLGVSIQSGGTYGLASNDDDIEFRETLEIAAAQNPTFRDRCMLLQPILDSMTVCLSLFALFVLGETITMVLRMYGYDKLSNSLGFLSSIFTLLVYGTTIIVSAIARGCTVYSQCFKCWLECSILFVDATALWYATLSRKDTLEEKEEDSSKNTRIYMSVFGYVVFLHALRIFHMFYVTLKPSTKDRMNNSNALTTSSQVWSGKEEICSVQGILINRKYSSMRFAAKGLLPPILQDGLSDLFSMQFYGTREEELEEDEHDRMSEDRMSEMMGSDELNLAATKASNLDGVFCAGRPDWNNVFLQAINRAHRTNREGDAVGVFFCGSPAIAKDLQAEAKRITAQHQFVTKRRHGRACKCKLIVHTENF